MSVNERKENDICKMKKWLCVDLKLNEYLDMFINDGWDDMDVISTLTDQDLIDIGISKKGHRRKIIKSLSRMECEEGK